MKRIGLVLLVFFFAVSLGGCSCLQKQATAENPPPAKVAKAPEPVKPAPPPPPPPPKKDRN
jgi:hypothetical protein